MIEREKPQGTIQCGAGNMRFVCRVTKISIQTFDVQLTVHRDTFLY